MQNNFYEVEVKLQRPITVTVYLVFCDIIIIFFLVAKWEEFHLGKR